MWYIKYENYHGFEKEIVGLLRPSIMRKSIPYTIVKVGSYKRPKDETLKQSKL